MKPAYFSILLLMLASIAGVMGYVFYNYSQVDDVNADPAFALKTVESANTKPMRRPDFTLVDVKGQLHHNAEWDGKIVVLNFWATWCPPCLQEIPMFMELQKQYGEKGLQFVGIAIDNIEAVQNFVETVHINYPILVDESKAIRIAQHFGNRVGTLPYTVIINRQGKIILRHAGEIDQEQVEQVVLPLL